MYIFNNTWILIILMILNFFATAIVNTVISKKFTELTKGKQIVSIFITFVSLSVIVFVVYYQTGNVTPVSNLVNYKVEAVSVPENACTFVGTGYDFKNGDNYDVSIKYDETKYRFDGWVGNNSGTIMSENISLKAKFTPLIYSVNASSSPVGAADFYGIGENFSEGDSYEISYTYDDSKFEFSNVSQSLSGTIGKENVDVLVSFTPIYYSVTAESIPAGAASFSGTGTKYYNGDVYNVEPSYDKTKYKFLEWDLENTGTIKTEDIHLVAKFEKIDPYKTIGQMKFLSSNEDHVTIGSFTSNYGDRYSSSIVADDGFLEQAYGKYEIVLNGEYKRFTATFAPTDSMTNSKVFNKYAAIRLTGDGEILEDLVINSNSSPIDIDIEILEVEKLTIEIVAKAASSYNSTNSSEAGLGGMKFYY